MRGKRYAERFSKSSYIFLKEKKDLRKRNQDRNIAFVNLSFCAPSTARLLYFRIINSIFLPARMR